MKCISIIKSVLGILAMLASIPLFFFGFGLLIFCSAVSNAEPDFANSLALFGISALVSCLVLLFLGWALFKSAGSPDKRAPEEEHLCPKCGCRIRPGFTTCQWCGADLK